MVARKWIHRTRLLALLFGIPLALSFSSAEACGCGMYIPREGEASVAQERALIRWDGHTEDIVMALGVLGGSKEAAVLLPVPARATVKLGDAKIFDALQELTKPRVQKQFALFPPIMLGAGAPAPGAAPPVALLERQTLGPFDVSTLAATDAKALSEWLKANGYSFPPNLATVLQPYVAQNWFYVAVRLTPGANGETLKGMLDPLWVTFASDKIIYPMRPSALARGNLGVFIYVLAEHRVEKPMSFGSQSVPFADWVEPSSLEKGSALAPFVSRRLFLTKIVEQIYSPCQIDDDYVFTFTAKDETYREVEYEYVYEVAGVPNLLWAFCLACMLPVALLFAGILVFARRRARPPAVSSAPV
jgi:hypothetical protein